MAAHRGTRAAGARANGIQTTTGAAVLALHHGAAPEAAAAVDPAIIEPNPRHGVRPRKPLDRAHERVIEGNSAGKGHYQPLAAFDQAKRSDAFRSVEDL